eukprot:4067587-Prymnesium_polylepis.1
MHKVLTAMMHVECAAAVQRDGERAYGRAGRGAAPGGASRALGLGRSCIVCERSDSVPSV